MNLDALNNVSQSTEKAGYSKPPVQDEQDNQLLPSPSLSSQPASSKPSSSSRGETKAPIILLSDSEETGSDEDVFKPSMSNRNHICIVLIL